MKKTNKKIFIIIIAIAIVLVIGGVAFTFFTKPNNKSSFLEYAEQIFDEENGFLDNRLVQFLEKKESSAYENEGKLKISIDNENTSYKVADEMNNNFNISFAGNTDNVNNKAEQLIKINYSRDASFPIMYKKVGNMQALKLKKIMEKYISTNKNDLFGVFNINKTTQIENKDEDNDIISFSDEDNADIELAESNISQEDKNALKNELINLIKENVDEKAFSKVSTQEEEGYVANIEGEQFKELISTFIDKISKNQKLLDKLNLNNYISFIKSYISQLITDQGNSSVTLYQKNKKLNRIVLELNGVMKIEVKKQVQDDGVIYSINVTTLQNGDNITIEVNIDLSGLNDLKTITEKFNVDYGINDVSYTFNLENKVNFTEITIDNLNEDEYVNLDKLSEADVQKVIMIMVQRSIQANLKLIEEVGIADTSDLASILPSDSNNGLQEYLEKNRVTTNVNNTTNTDNTTNANNANNTTNTTNTTNTSNTTASANTTTTNNTSNTENQTTTSNRSELANSFSETEKKVYNSNYEKYTQESIDGNKVKSLMLDIIANNMSDEERQIKVTGDIELNGNEVPQGIESKRKYVIQLGYSNDGFVNEVKVLEKPEE